MIIQAIFIFYAIPYFTDGAVNLEVTLAAYLVVSINTGAYMAGNGARRYNVDRYRADRGRKVNRYEPL